MCTGFDAIDTGNATLAFLSEIGFAMLMFAIGMSVPLRERGIRESLGTGATDRRDRGGDRGRRRAARVADRGEPGHPGGVCGPDRLRPQPAAVLPILQGRGRPDLPRRRLWRR